MRVAIVGAGPIGIEAALHAAERGHDVQVYERGAVGANVAAWGHVGLFSPWRLNRSRLGLATLVGSRAEPAPAEVYPTGRDYLEQYLAPLARSCGLVRRIHEGHAVVQVGRDRIAKSDLIGGPRERHPFRLLLEGPLGESVTQADVVLDCSGTYGHPNWIGNGNLPACGERALAGRIDYTLQDIGGESRRRFEGRRVLLVGSGHSAATALAALVGLAGTHVVWVVRGDVGDPLPVIDDDPLPERERLSRLANRLAGGADSRVDCRRSTAVERVSARGDGFDVVLSSRGVEETVLVDRILAHVGYRPDSSLYRELQVHECYATAGPMGLAATLLGSAAGDCLAGSAVDGAALRNPEPNFFILGAKSYGRRSDFLIRTGIDQLRRVLELIEDEPRP